MDARQCIIAILAVVAVQIAIPTHAGVIQTTEEFTCPGVGIAWWGVYDKDGKKTEQGGKNCKKDETVTVPIAPGTHGKYVAFQGPGQNRPDPGLVESFVSGAPGAFSLGDLTLGIYSRIGLGSFTLPLLEELGFNLYVLVDLDTFLNAIPLGYPGAVTLVDGKSVELPGMTVSETEPTFSSLSGWGVTHYSGSATVVSLVTTKLEHIPEPSTAMLMLAGMLCWLRFRAGVTI